MAMPAPLVVPSYTIDDLDRFPADGNRYELLDGVLLVTQDTSRARSARLSSFGAIGTQVGSDPSLVARR